MMQKYQLNRQCLILMLGLPGAGKTYFSRQISELLNVSHVSGDRIRYELFSKATLDETENHLVGQIMNYMTENLIKSGASVIYDDVSTLRYKDRFKLRQYASDNNIPILTVWVQTDSNTCASRALNRDRRTIDDKYSHSIDRKAFDKLSAKLEKPQYREEYTVISGKYGFKNQATSFVKKLRELELLNEPTPNKKEPPAIRPLSSPRREPLQRHIRIR